jgi:hypothetical protein
MDERRRIDFGLSAISSIRLDEAMTFPWIVLRNS